MYFSTKAYLFSLLLISTISYFTHTNSHSLLDNFCKPKTLYFIVSFLFNFQRYPMIYGTLKQIQTYFPAQSIAALPYVSCYSGLCLGRENYQLLIILISFHRNENHILFVQLSQDLGILRSTEERNTLLILNPDIFLPISLLFLFSLLSLHFVWDGSDLLSTSGTCLRLRLSVPGPFLCSLASLYASLFSQMFSSELGQFQFIFILSLKAECYNLIFQHPASQSRMVLMSACPFVFDLLSG